MDKKLMMQNETYRKKSSLKAMYFNRYLLIRYIIALFFFTNLYWMFALLLSQSSMVLLPIILIILWTIAMLEQTKIYSNHSNISTKTVICFMLNIFSNIIQIVFVLLNSNMFFPFLKMNDANKIILILLNSLGLMILFVGCKRLKKIANNQDKHLSRINAFEKLNNLEMRY